MSRITDGRVLRVNAQDLVRGGGEGGVRVGDGVAGSGGVASGVVLHGGMS